MISQLLSKQGILMGSQTHVWSSFCAERSIGQTKVIVGGETYRPSSQAICVKGRQIVSDGVKAPTNIWRKK